MPAIKVSISDMKTAIAKAQGKVDEASASDRDQRILDSQIRAANDKVKSSEAGIKTAEMTKQQAEDKLSPPPTKQITSDGKKGGSKTVVDEAEKDKLQAQVRAADVQIKQAHQTVDDAKAEAERLTSQALDGAGVSSDQQKSMSDLSNLMSELKTMANDPQTNLEGDAFQDKLEKAVNKIGVLEKDLPNTNNTQLADFWKEITGGMKEIEEKFTKATTPAAYTIKTGDRAANYSTFFQDYQQGMTTLLEKLPANIDPTTKALLQDAKINIAKHSPSSPDAKSLEGFSADDEKAMTETMDKVNALINNLQRGRPVTNEDYANLISGSTGLETKLANGGSYFNSLLTVEFNSMGTHADSIGRNLTLQGQTDNLADFTSAANRMRAISNPAGLKGLTTVDHRALKAIAERLRVMNETLSGGGSVTDASIRSLIDDSNTLVDRLSTNYQLTTASTASTGSSFGTGVGVGSGNNSFASSSLGR